LYFYSIRLSSNNLKNETSCHHRTSSSTYNAKVQSFSDVQNCVSIFLYTCLESIVVKPPSNYNLFHRLHTAIFANRVQYEKANEKKIGYLPFHLFEQTAFCVRKALQRAENIRTRKLKRKNLYSAYRFIYFFTSFCFPADGFPYTHTCTVYIVSFYETLLAALF
jgi:hypothetical protein